MYLGLIVVLTGGIVFGPGLVARLVESRASADGPEMVEAVPEVVAEAPAAPAVTEDPQVTASAAAPADLPEAGEGNAAAALAAVVAGAAEPEPAPVAEVAEDRTFPVVRGGKASLNQTTAAILAELAIVKDGTSTESEALEAMSTSAIAGLKGARGKGDTVETLETLVASALREGKPDAEIDQMVNEAAVAGTVSVPAELVTPEGKVDTAILLSSLVSQAQIAAGVAEPVDPDSIIVGGEGVEVHMVTHADGTSVEAQFYTVNNGDSLGAIARRFYGDAVMYNAIFEANRAILSSPDRIMVGQRLVIPQI